MSPDLQFIFWMLNTESKASLCATAATPSCNCANDSALRTSQVVHALLLPSGLMILNAEMFCFNVFLSWRNQGEGAAVLLGGKLSQALGDTTLGTSLRRGLAQRYSYYCTTDSLLSHE